MALLPPTLHHLHARTHDLPKCHLKRAPNGGLMNQKTRFSVVMSTQISSTEERPIAVFKPTIWTYNYVQSLRIHHMDEKHETKLKKLEEEVRAMINNENSELLTLLELIDDIERLGLGCRFRMDVRGALERIISWEVGSGVKPEKKLHATALKFRLLRQHGYEISQDVFKTFMDQNHNYIASLRGDVTAMLSLYEASYLAFPGESLLVEAQTISRTHLKELVGKVEPAMSKLITHSLEVPLHRRMSRLEARWYIEAYDKLKDTNYSLLELAKLDFNWVQSIYQRDLKEMSRWWKEINLANKLKFARDRLTESFFFMVGLTPEPQYSSCRKGLTKVFAFVTVIDDIYDVYGTSDELELFTDAVERWDINSVDELPDYMKICFLALYNSVNEMAYDILNEQGENVVPYLKKAWFDLCKGFLQEAKWRFNKHTPTFEEYIDNAWLSVSGVLNLVHSFFLMNGTVNKEALESVENYQHNLFRWPAVIYRLCNDFGTSKAEIERGETASSILCYMKEEGLSEELAREKVGNLVEETWKKLNKDRIYKYPFDETFAETAVNHARTVQCVYQYGDGHGDPDDRAKNRILSAIIDPIPLN